jgi:hypothetical protein
MALDTFDFAFQPSVEKARIDVLATGDFIRKKENMALSQIQWVG